MVPEKHMQQGYALTLARLSRELQGLEQLLGWPRGLLNVTVPCPGCRSSQCRRTEPKRGGDTACSPAPNVHNSLALSWSGGFAAFPCLLTYSGVSKSIHGKLL